MSNVPDPPSVREVDRYAPFECDECHRCLGDKPGLIDGLPMTMFRLILCPICGNKRCPHASDRRLACTLSNEVGQPGSVYQ